MDESRTIEIADPEGEVHAYRLTLTASDWSGAGVEGELRRLDTGDAYRILSYRSVSGCWLWKCGCRSYEYSKATPKECKHTRALLEKDIMPETTEIVHQNGSTDVQPATPRQPGSCPQLARALAAVQQRCRAVAKDSRNEYHKYKYASSEAVLIEAQHALAESGLAVLPVEQVLDGWQREGENRFELRRRFLLIHSSGECMPLSVAWPVCPEKGRPLDKATAIAATLSLAYLLRDLCLMPRVDPEAELAGREDREWKLNKTAWAELQAEMKRTNKSWKACVATLKLAPGTKAAALTKDQYDAILNRLKKLPDKAPDAQATPQGTPTPQQPAPANGHEQPQQKQSAAPTHAQERALPLNGEELEKRLVAKEESMARDGLCREGELLAYVLDDLSPAHGIDMSKWSRQAIMQAKDEVLVFEARQRAAAGKQPAGAK